MFEVHGCQKENLPYAGEVGRVKGLLPTDWCQIFHAYMLAKTIQETSILRLQTCWVRLHLVLHTAQCLLRWNEVSKQLLGWRYLQESKEDSAAKNMRRELRQGFGECQGLECKCLKVASSRSLLQWGCRSKTFNTEVFHFSLSSSCF